MSKLTKIGNSYYLHVPMSIIERHLLDRLEENFICEINNEDIIFKELDKKNYHNQSDIKNILSFEKKKCFITSTGYKELDKIIGGFESSRLYIIGSRPAMGKSAFMLNLAKNLVDDGKNVLFVSLEMTMNRLAERYFALNADVLRHRLEDGTLTEEEFERVKNQAMTDRLYFYGDTNNDIDEIYKTIESSVKNNNVQIVFIDYLQLIKTSAKNKSFQTDDIIKILKKLAMQLDIAIIISSQLTRAVEERVGHIPILTDLRNSGSIEEDADCVMFVYRKEYYDPHNRPGLIEIIVSKNKYNGQLEKIWLHWDKYKSEKMKEVDLKSQLIFEQKCLDEMFEKFT